MEISNKSISQAKFPQVKSDFKFNNKSFDDPDCRHEVKQFVGF